MISNRFHFHTFSFFMSLSMSGVMSIAMLLVEHRNVFEAFAMWPTAWAISMLVAFPASMLVVPIAQKLTSRIVAEN